MPRFLTSWFPAAAGLAALAGVALSAPAGAVPLMNGQSLTVNAYGTSATFTVANCTSSIYCTDAVEFVQDGTNLGVKIEKVGGGSLLVGIDDFGVDFDITATRPFTGLTLGMSGSGTFLTSVGETLSTGDTLFVSPGGSSTDSVFFASTMTLSGSKDIGSFADGEYITFVTQDLLPEPASVGLLAAGLGLTVWLRRRRTA